MDKTISVIEELTESLKESDNVMLQLEEKRMKFDKKLIEMEYKRSKENEEREERQRREEREFQLRVMMHGQQQGSTSFEFNQPYF